MRFSGKSVLITGGTSGLGAATVLAFVREGARVAFCGREKDLAEKVEGEIRKLDGTCFWKLADVTRPEAMEGFIKEAAKAQGGIDIAVNGAGRNNPPNRLADIPVREFKGVLETNLFGVFYAMRAEIPEVLKTKGVIINVASVLSAKPSGWMAAYSASKTGLVALTQSAAEDYRDLGLRIYAISPGPMATPMFDQALRDIAGDAGKYAGGLPKGGKALPPEKVAAAILDLADPEIGPETGTNLIFAGK